MNTINEITINEITINEITINEIIINEITLNENDNVITINEIDSEEPNYIWTEYIPLFLGLMWYIFIVILNLFKEIPPVIPIWENYSTLQDSFTLHRAISWIILIFFTIISVIIIHFVMNRKIVVNFYLVILLIVFTSNIVGNNMFLRSNGFGASIWCIIFGAVFRIINKKTDILVKSVLSLEFFIKVAIVLLAINLNEIAIVGWKGLIVAWIETVLLLVFIYWVGVSILKMDSTEALIVAVGLSICGSSAVVSIQHSINVSEKIVYSMICLMSIFTIPFIPLLPFLGKHFNFTDTLIGVWIGGSIDSTGAVAASGVLGGINILHIAIILKMLQNILIAPITLIVTVIWTQEYKIYLLWQKFPKFVLGFVLVAIITTLLPFSLQKDVVNNTFIISEWFSSVSFVLIGMGIDLLNLDIQFNDRQRMIILYVFGQTLDTFTTLGVAYIMYSVIL